MRQRVRDSSAKSSSSNGENGSEGSELEGNSSSDVPRVVTVKRPARGVLLMFVLAIYGAWEVYHHQFQRLPRPLSAEQAGKRGFSEHEAWKHAKALTELGPRPVASDALDHALQYVLEASNAIKRNAHWEVYVEVDLFHASSGANKLNSGLFEGKTLVYSDLKHIVLRISPRYAAEAKDSAILVSSHIDTVFSGEGAGDCTSCISTMLELARGVSQWAHGFKNAVIFLFNTGEEEGLTGVHSFVTQHPWIDTIKMAIDLEAMGIGGKSTIFQAGPSPWAIEIYAAVAKHPSAQIIAQDVFTSGVINSATDFQIYKEVAGLSGLDFAYMDKTAVYHTKNDKLSLLTRGSLQHLGDNMLAFLIQAAASADLSKGNAVDSNGSSGQKATYFDILGAYMIVYRQDFATMLYNSVITQALLIWGGSLGMGGCTAVVSLALSFLSVILMWMFSISFSTAVACVLPFISSFSAVPFVSSPLLVVGLLGAPALLGAFTGQHVGYLLLQAYLEHTISKKKRNLPSRVRDDLANLDAERWLFKAGSFQWLILLVVGNYFKVGSTYVAVVWLIPPALAYGLLEATLSPARFPKPLKTFTLLLGLSVPFLITSGMVIRLGATIIGNTVRFDRNPGAMPEWLGNMVIAVYVAAVICLTMVYLLSYVHNSGAKVPIIVITSLVFGLSLCVVLVGMVPPYTDDTARAVNVVHVVDTTGRYGEKTEPVSYISLFSTTPGDLTKELELMTEEFVCDRNTTLDFVTFSVKYACRMDKGVETGWDRSDIPVLHVDSKESDRITQVSIDTKSSTRWALGINTDAVEDFQLKDDVDLLVPAGNMTSKDGWHTIQFSGGKKSPTKFTLTLFWVKNPTQTGAKNRPLLKLRTDLFGVTPAVDSVLRKLPSWCGLFGKSTSPHTFSFLSNMPIDL